VIAATAAQAKRGVLRGNAQSSRREKNNGCIISRLA